MHSASPYYTVLAVAHGMAWLYYTVLAVVERMRRKGRWGTLFMMCWGVRSKHVRKVEERKRQGRGEEGRGERIPSRRPKLAEKTTSSPCIILGPPPFHWRANRGNNSRSG